MLKDDLKHAAGLLVGYIFSPIAALCSYIPHKDKVKGPFFDGLRQGSVTGIFTIAGGVLFFPIGALAGFVIGAAAGKFLAEANFENESLKQKAKPTTNSKPPAIQKHNYRLPQHTKQKISSITPSPTPQSHIKAVSRKRNKKRT